MGRPRKVRTDETETPALPHISVLAKRLQSPFGEGSPAIQLKEPGWTVHVINTRVKPGRYHDVTRNKGWIPITPEDVDGSAEDFGFDIRDGRVVRGDRSEEVVVKMPTADYEAIQMAKDVKNRQLNSPRQLKAAAAQQTAVAHGDEAGDYIDSHVSIKTTRSPVPLEDESAS